MAFLNLKLFFFRQKNKALPNFASFFVFVYLLLSLINDKSHTTICVFDEGAIKRILRAKIWLYGFESVFWQVLFDFLFVFYLFFFL